MAKRRANEVLSSRLRDRDANFDFKALVRSHETSHPPLSLLVSASLFAQTAAPKAPAKPKGPTIPADAQWHDVTTWGVEGRGWGDQERKRWFDRFPRRLRRPSRLPCGASAVTARA
jgi:hypothetical protein